MNVVKVEYKGEAYRLYFTDENKVFMMDRTAFMNKYRRLKFGPKTVKVAQIFGYPVEECPEIRAKWLFKLDEERVAKMKARK